MMTRGGTSIRSPAMRINRRRIVFFASVLTAACATAAGCGDEEGATPNNADTGAGDSSTSGDNAVTDTSSSRDTSTSTSDTSTAADVVSSDARSPEFTGAACQTASQCYASLDAMSLKGAP